MRGNTRQLTAFHQNLSTLRFLDPACGCGNFLIITYRELRLLEIDVIKVLQKGQMVFNVSDLVRVDVSQFYGIEYEEFPARIAEVALWLMDHQMNMRVSEEFGEYYARLPLRSAARIVHGNALGRGLGGGRTARPIKLHFGQSAVHRCENDERFSTRRNKDPFRWG